MKAKPAAGGCRRGVTCLRLSMLTDIAKADLRLFGSRALCVRLSAVNRTAILGPVLLKSSVNRLIG